MAITQLGSLRNRFLGLSTDTKPEGQDGATFLEYDTGRLFIYDGTNWILKTIPLYMYETTTVNLKQAAGAYDLFTAPSALSIQVLEFGIIIPADLTGTAAGSLTSIAVASTDTSPIEMISSTAGAKANLSSGKHLLYIGGDVVAATKKIQLTIGGGSTTANQVCSCWIKYQGVV